MQGYICKDRCQGEELLTAQHCFTRVLLSRLLWRGERIFELGEQNSYYYLISMSPGAVEGSEKSFVGDANSILRLQFDVG